jgi:ligand-binding sensor domain-containing protein
MHTLFCFRLGLMFVLLVNVGPVLQAQTDSFKQVSEIPSKEVFDLFNDSKGFIWVANNLGISRYDGIKFVTFSSPLQSSLACTGIVEDEQGRIWINNFSGQIFYIEHDEMKLLFAYDSSKESAFPAIAIHKGNLYATSDHGLFILNTANMKGHYVAVSNSLSSVTNSLTVLNNGILAYGNREWFLYKFSGSFRRIPFAAPTDVFKGNYSKLSNQALADTAFFFSNPTGLVNKIFLQNDTVKVKKEWLFNSFINTISISAGTQWVNTTKLSQSLTGSKRLEGRNISDIITDKTGNVWYSSLSYGLWVIRAASGIRYKDLELY